MTNWKKLIYSGSDAFVNDISASSMHLAGIGDVSTSIAIATAGTIWQTDTNGVSLINGESNVGIGDVSQANYKLDVSGSIRINKLTDTAIRIAGGGNSDRTLLRVDSGVGATDFSQYGFSVKYMGSRSGNDNSFSIFADNQTETATEAFTILQDGKIGIGTTAPSNLLQLHEVGNSNAQLYIYATGSDGNENAAGIKLFAHNNYTQEAFVKIDDDGLQIGTTNNEPIRFFTDNTVESLRLVHGASGESANVIFHPADTTLFISQSGKVGIGTDDPFLPLHVNGNARIEGYLMTGNAAATNTPAAPLHIKNSGTAFIRLEDLDADNSIYDISVNSGSGFSILEDSNTRLFIEEGGNVGIATTNPGTTLEVRGPYVSGDITGSVIGTYQIAVVGNGQDGIQLLGSHTSEVRVVFGDKDDGDIGQIAYDNATDDMKFITNTSEKMVITDTGEVGIGATVPARQLHVKDSAETVAVKIEAPDGSQASVDLENSEGAFRIINDGGALNFHDDAGSNKSRMYIRSGSGRVGIGTTNPSNKLHVSGSIRISNSGDTSLILDSQNGANDDSIIDFRENSVKRALVYWDGTANDFVISSSIGDFHLLPTSNVGIGTTTPSKKLTVQGDISASGDIKGSRLLGHAPDGNTLSLQLGRTDNANYWSFNHAGNDLRIYNTAGAGSNILLGVNASSNQVSNKVGIGNPEPPKALTVQGTISASGDLNIVGDAAIDGDLGIGGSIFGLSGFGVTIDDIAVTSGSTNFGSGSNPAESIHSRTGSMSITGSTFTFNGENVLTNASEIYWHDTGTQITSSKSVGISGSVHVQGDITASSLSIVPNGTEVIEFAASSSIADGIFTTLGLLNFAGSNGFIGHKNNVNPFTGLTKNGIQFNANDNSLILGGESFINIKNEQETAGSSIQFKGYHDMQFGTSDVANIMYMTQSYAEISDARITGSLEGTASYAVSASHAVSSTSASYALSSTSASYALTASYALSSTSASYALTASYALNAGDDSVWYNGGSFITSSVDTKISGSLTITNANAAQLILRGDSGNVGDAGQIDNIIDLLLDTEAYGYRINTENYSAKTALNFQEKINNAYTSRLYINEDGNVGIGTSSPTSKLHVNGVVTASGVNIKDGTYNNYLNLDRTSHGDIAQVIKISPTTPSGGSGLTALQINIGTGQFQFTEQSRLGIGTLNPSTELEVNGDIKAETLELTENISVAGEVTAPLTFNSNANIIASGSKNHFRNTVSSTKFTAYKNVSELASQNAGGGSITIDPSGIGSGYPIYLKADDVGLKIYNSTSANREIHLGRFGGSAAASNLTGSLVIKKDGDLRLHAYGAGNQTGTATYTLGVDSSGNVIEFNSISGADAATLDGIDSTSFLRSDQNDDFSGTLNYTPNTGTILSVDGQAILQRMTANGALTIGHDDSVIIAGGDTSTVMNTNITNSDEKVFIGAEGGLVVHAFPGNDTAWSNRKSMIFNGTDLQVLGNRVLTTADEGTGNGLDADTVDNIQASSFLRSDTANTGTGRITLTGGLSVSGNAGDGNSSQIIISDTSPQIKFNDTDHDNFYIHVNSNNFYVLADRDSNDSWESPHPLQLEADTNTAYTFGNRILTTADEGSGNGLDADTLDGNHASAFLTSIANNSIGNTELAFDTGQHLTTTSNPTFNILYIKDSIYHEGNFGTSMKFDTDVITFNTGNTPRLKIGNTGGVSIGHPGNYPESSPANILDIRHDGSDGENGIMIVVDDADTNDLLGGIGFDSEDGNVPSSILEASAYIAAFAGEIHGTGDKGGYLTFGVTEQNDNDDTTSTEVVRIAMNKKVHFKDDIVAFSSTVSDMRLKTDIQLLTGSLDTICNLEGVRYNWKYRDTGPQLGVIAQQVEPYVPEIIKETELPLHAKEKTDTTKYKTVQYEQLVPHLIEAIKELKAEVDELKSRLTDAE